VVIARPPICKVGEACVSFGITLRFWTVGPAKA
jgi:hypothetical protein